MKNAGAEDKTTYHFQKRETPLVLYNALNLYGQFRSKYTIINQFHIILSVPYLRILKITKFHRRCDASETQRSEKFFCLEVHKKVYLQ